MAVKNKPRGKNKPRVKRNGMTLSLTVEEKATVDKARLRRGITGNRNYIMHLVTRDLSRK